MGPGLATNFGPELAGQELPQLAAGLYAPPVLASPARRCAAMNLKRLVADIDSCKLVLRHETGKKTINGIL